MTHGEETGPETHQDSAVLTYLEGLLMHRVAGAQSATTTQRSEAEKGNKEQGNKETTGLTLPRHSTQQEQEKTSPQGGSTHHVRKARLLRSEAWTEHESQMKSMPSGELNGGEHEHHSGLNGSLQCKGESTLLANLLQNFTTRLQNVALSQQIVQNLMPQTTTQNPVNKPDEGDQADGDDHGSGSSETGNSIVQNHSSSKLYHHREPSQERVSKSPLALQHNTLSPSSESLPCTERLKAVASLVNIRSSPAPSPKPSVACSQLALLLSSEAHLQQYSREHALKAQLAGRSASERLAAMATQKTQEWKQTSTSGKTKKDGLSSLQIKNGIASQISTDSSRQSPSSSTVQSRSVYSVQRAHPFRERRPFERHSRPSQNCSSLLLQLLNSHNTPQRLTCQGHLKEDISVFSSRGSPLFLDSDQSNSGNSLPKDSSDAESSRSSCSPIDLSLKNKVSLSLSSTPPMNMVQKNRCISGRASLKVSKESKELHACTEIKPHHKITLLELLLDQKHNEKTKKGLDDTDLTPLTIPRPSKAPASKIFQSGQVIGTREPSPNCRLNSRSPKLLPIPPQGRDSNIRASPYNLCGSLQTQSVPLDLCKSKPAVTGTAGVTESSFSASKLLQNLAQCGKQNTASSPSPKVPFHSVKRQTEELKTSVSVTLLDKLTAPLQKNSSQSSEVAHLNSPNSFVAEPAQHGSEIENLLERRTVLQLLLGNKSQKVKSGNKRKRESGHSVSTEKLASPQNCHNLNSPIPDISVKSEPDDDEDVYSNGQIKRTCQNQESIKQEPISPVSVSRDGLLCHLLHHQSRTLKPNSLEHLNRGCIKEELVEHQGPTIPKKRKFSVEREDHAEMSQQSTLNSSGSQKDNSNCSASVIAEIQESSDSFSPPEADSPAAKFQPGDSPRKENGGFNVLKQLLLSDNCLKELAQSRSTFCTQTHPVLNGNTNKGPCNNGQVQNFHQSQSLNPNKKPTMRRGTDSPSDGHLSQQDGSFLKHNTNSKRDSKASVNGNKMQNCDLDSPRLTKANPILYYMLQRSNAHLVRDRVELDAKSAPCGVQMKDKEESEAYDLKQNLQQNPHNQNRTPSCDSPCLNGSLQKS